MFHIMDTPTRYFTGTAVPDTGMEAAVEFLDSHWISPFGLLHQFNLINLSTTMNSKDLFQFTS